MPKKDEKKKFKWGWAYTVVSVLVVLTGLIGFTIYEGTVGKEQAIVQADQKACTDFNNALGNAYKTTTAKDFFWVLFRGAYAGIEATRTGTAVNDDFTKLAQLEAYVDNTTWDSMLVTVGDATSKVQADCAVILKVKVTNWDANIPHTSGAATATPTPTPSASKKN